ncbi:MAG: DNA polymerase III subunit delta [Candidatus Aminicenantia bacterium]
MNYTQFIRNLEKKNITPCYFFYGRETFLADQALTLLRSSIIPPESEDFNYNKFSLEENSWQEIISTAQTIPFLSSGRRLISVKVKDKRSETISSVDLKILKEYFSSPASFSIIVISVENPDRKKPLYKFFSSLSPEICCLVELKPLKENQLYLWIDDKLAKESKKLTPEGKARLIEIVGTDLRNLDNELEKLITFVGKKEIIQSEDIEEITGDLRTFAFWELSNCLEKADFEKSLKIINHLTKEGTHHLVILGVFLKFFQRLLLVKLMMKEKHSFQEISQRTSIPVFKTNNIIKLAQQFSGEELNLFISELKTLDLKFKSTDSSPQALLENFLYFYCTKRKKK